MKTVKLLFYIAVICVPCFAVEIRGRRDSNEKKLSANKELFQSDSKIEKSREINSVPLLLAAEASGTQNENVKNLTPVKRHNSGYNSNLGNSGYNGNLGNSGYNGNLGNSGYNGNLGNSGYNGNLGNSGYNGNLGNTGYNGNLGNTGYNDNLGNSGFNDYLGNSGYNGNLGNTGNLGNPGYNGNLDRYAHNGNTGDFGLGGNFNNFNGLGSQDTILSYSKDYGTSRYRINLKLGGLPWARGTFTYPGPDGRIYDLNWYADKNGFETDQPELRPPVPASGGGGAPVRIIG